MLEEVNKEEAEQAIINPIQYTSSHVEVGGLLQLIDDYQDVVKDLIEESDQTSDYNY